MCLCASGNYILNDAWDATSDRLHPTKQFRPIANASIDRKIAITIGIALLSGTVAAAFLWLPAFGGLLVAYLGLSLVYTAWVKGLLIYDAVLLAALYSGRLVMGAVVANVAISSWLLTFATMFFFSLTLAKRYSELVAISSNGLTASPGRAYALRDQQLILALGPSMGMVSILVLALYITETAYSVQLYSQPAFLWASVLIICLWLIYVWSQAHSGQLTTEPVEFALTDRTSLLMAVALALTVFISKW